MLTSNTSNLGKLFKEVGEFPDSGHCLPRSAAALCWFGRPP